MTDKRDLLPSEDSIPLRLVVYLMTMTCIAAACIFIKTNWPVIVLSVALASIGSVVAYQNRHEKVSWMQWVVIIGVVAVGANAGAEFMDPNNGATDFWGPIVHFVAGTFCLHTFDLKTRSDINLSALLGAIILCFLAPVARSVFFGLAVFNYICLGTVMLYFDCMSRTLHNWLEKPMQPAPVVDVANITGRRKPRGSVYFTVALLPILAAICFLFVPRCDNLMDIIMSSLKHIDLSQVFKAIAGAQPTAPSINVPRHEFQPVGKNNIKFKKKQRELENQDEVDKKLQEMGVDKHKLVKTKTKEDDKKKEEQKKKEDEKKSPQKPPEPKKDEKKKSPKKSSKGAGSPEEHKHAERPRDNKLGENFLDLDTNPPDSIEIVYKVTTTRLFNLRRQVFDDFDGRKWTRSKDKLKQTDVDIKDMEKLEAPKDPKAANPEEPAAQQKELSPEEEAEKELQQEKLSELSKRDTGYGADMAVNYVFNEPQKGDFKIGETSAFRLPSKLPCITLTQTYDVQVDADKLFPAAWMPQDLSFTKGKKVVVDDYGEITNAEPLKKDTRFSVTSQYPIYNLPAMRQEPVLSEDRENQIRDELSNYLTLPDSLSDEVLDIANTMAGKTGNWFTVAERICMQMRAAASPEIDKPGDYEPAEDRVKDFLIDRKHGNYKDFSTAYIICCRAVGLPARMVYGFREGSFNKATGTQDIRMTDAATWAEVYIPDYGWVPFDPAPGGVMPGVKRDEGFSFWNVLKWICNALGIPLDDEGLTPKKIIALISIVISSIFLLVGMVLGIILLIKWRRNQKNKNPWQDAAWKIWNDLAKDFKKARMERMPTETPTEFVDRINRIVQEQRKEGAMTGYELPQALKEFFVTYEAVHFGNKEGLPMLKGQAQELKKLVKANKSSEKAADASSKAVRKLRR